MELVARLTAEGRHEELAQLGDHAEPLPDWVRYHTTAENMTCPPWEMFEADETPPPKWWWRETRNLLDAARNEAREQQDARRKQG